MNTIVKTSALLETYTYKIGVNFKKHTTSFFAGTGLILVFALSIFSYISTNKYLKSNDWRLQSAKVLAAAHHAQMSSERAETAQRGFLMTGREALLKTYDSAIFVTHSELKNLEELVQDNPKQLQNLNLIQLNFNTRLQLLNSNIELFQAGEKRKVYENVRSGKGQNLMDRLRKNFHNFVEDEKKLFASRSIRAKKDLENSTLFALTGLLAAFCLMFVCIYFFRRESARRLEAEKLAITASILKSQFLANMSHEIRTPLNGIIGMTSILKETELTQEQADYLNTIQDSSQSLLSLINQILDLSKIESGKLQLEETHFELRSLVSSATSILNITASSKGVALDLQIDNDVPDLYLGDPLRIRHVLLNLLGNAIKFSPKGKVSLTIKKKFERDSMIGLSFEVIDQGIGMSADVIGRIFRSFSQGDDSTTRMHGGTGLGLVISKELVELMGGEIGVESSQGKGSRFFFDLNLKAEKYQQPEIIPSTADDIYLGGHILIAEDNLTNQKVVTAMLKSIGCTFEVAANGKEALKILTQEVFDMILMDGQMPELDGYETTLRIRAGEAGNSCRTIPIIAVTASAIKGDVERCLEVGMDDYISKPISQEDLTFRLKKWLGSRGRSFDPTKLRELDQLETDNMIGLAQEVVEIFIDSAPRIFKELKTALKGGDREGLTQIAHSFKSTCANVGAHRMKGINDRLERLSSTLENDDILKLIAALEKDFEIVKEEIRRDRAA